MSRLSGPALNLVERLLRLLRREYADGCRDRFQLEGGLESFGKHTQALPPEEGRLLRAQIKGLQGYSKLGLGQRQYALVQSGQHLASLCAPPPAPEPQSGEKIEENELQLPPAQRPQPSLAVYKLESPLERLRSISKTRQAAFQRLGLNTIGDLLLNFPRRWEDRRQTTSVSQVRAGAFELLELKIIQTQVYRGGGKLRLEALAYDTSGSIKLLWFNQAYLAKQLREGESYWVYGKVEYDARGILQLASPEISPRSKNSPSYGRIVPIYKLSAALYQSFMHQLMFTLVPTYAPKLEENLPPELLEKYALWPRAQAITELHWPSDYPSLQKAQRRLAFEELFWLQLRVAHKRALISSRQRQNKYAQLPQLAAQFQELLHFKLTKAQTRVIGEINKDLQSPNPLHRMLQGDVGSGKTVIAAWAAYAAIKNGYQAALMAPTEILAQQHYQKLTELLEPAHIRLELLSGSLTKRQKREAAQRIAQGEVDLVIGTHALIQDPIQFNNLSLTIIDEQHKFGVLQRQLLSAKGSNSAPVDLLLMTATPIPRTMSLTIYGDLEMSQLDELPPGRTPITSRSLSADQAPQAYAFIAQEVEKGHQAFIVCPLIDESDKLEASAATSEAERLARGPFRAYRVGLLHGKMKAAQKEELMQAFSRRQLDILISTTVIEVGIDIPQATTILIQDANRFGMAQLHQLRGRVGRSHLPSYCLFMASPDAPNLRKLEAMARLSDGFQVAEEDLEIRGPGDYFGTRQSGFPELQCADLTRDRALLEIAKEEAPRYASAYPFPDLDP